MSAEEDLVSKVLNLQSELADKHRIAKMDARSEVAGYGSDPKDLSIPLNPGLAYIWGPTIRYVAANVGAVRAMCCSLRPDTAPYWDQLQALPSMNGFVSAYHTEIDLEHALTLVGKIIQVLQENKPVEQSPVVVTPDKKEGERAARREGMLKRFKAAGLKYAALYNKLGATKDKHKVDRRDFYRWRHGELSDESDMTRKVEDLIESMLASSLRGEKSSPRRDRKTPHVGRQNGRSQP